MGPLGWMDQVGAGRDEVLRWEAELTVKDRGRWWLLLLRRRRWRRRWTGKMKGLRRWTVGRWGPEARQADRSLQLRWRWRWIVRRLGRHREGARGGREELGLEDEELVRLLLPDGGQGVDILLELDPSIFCREKEKSR